MDITNNKTKNIYGKTIVACFIGYVVQAIVNVFVPLLFVTFQNTYSIPLEKITLLITFNFVIQISVDLLTSLIIDKVGYRACALFAHISAALGLIMLTILPEIMPDPFIGLLIAVIFYAIGGGIIEVVVSPIVEACPSEHKDKTMSLLHSFYCWGSLAVVVISAIYFFTIGIANWKFLCIFWALVPIANAILFAFVPLKNIVPEGEKGLTIKELLKNKYFWLFFVVILCAGASEAGVAQWASTFVEQSLGLSKALGDLVGPAIFAVMMGTCRVFYGKKGDKIDLELAMAISGGLCVIAYLLIALVPSPIVSLIGMALCGLSVGLMWPGAYSSASSSIKNGGNAMFALLALGGDIGCTLGPTIVGFATDILDGNMKLGILCGIVFPLVLAVAMTVFRIKKQNKISLE